MARLRVPFAEHVIQFLRTNTRTKDLFDPTETGEVRALQQRHYTGMRSTASRQMARMARIDLAAAMSG
jgi:hypothetical protein